MGDAHSLHCPNCGAAADPGTGRCPYCLARLATVSCPSCFARIFEGAAFCPSCGTRRARIESDPDATRCPSCKGGLTRIQVGDTQLLECGSCDGVWVDADVFERLCASREVQSAVVHRFGERTAVAADGRVRYRPCLRCGKMMNRVNFGRLSGAIVDVCRGHGTFLDVGELHAILQFIQSGGLDRARNREIEELREERRQTEAARAREAQSQRPLSSARWDAGDAAAWSVPELLDFLANLKGD
jgi:Zn-finger nucleic acid-binding protein